jgi:hypothetical protein
VDLSDAHQSVGDSIAYSRDWLGSIPPAMLPVGVGSFAAPEYFATDSPSTFFIVLSPPFVVPIFNVSV